MIIPEIIHSFPSSQASITFALEHQNLPHHKFLSLWWPTTFTIRHAASHIVYSLTQGARKHRSSRAAHTDNSRLSWLPWLCIIFSYNSQSGGSLWFSLNFLVLTGLFNDKRKLIWLPQKQRIRMFVCQDVTKQNQLCWISCAGGSSSSYRQTVKCATQATGLEPRS